MRKRLLSAFALFALLTFVVGAVAGAAAFKSHVGHLIITLGGGVSPKAMPENEHVPVTTNVFGKIETDNDTHPSALREVVIDVDKDVRLNPSGYPICKPGGRQARNPPNIRKVCRKAILGSGFAHAQLSFPELPAIKVTSPITVLNGGTKGGKATLYIHAFLTVPVPAEIVTQVTIQKKGTGVHAVARIPVIAGGSGSVLDFKFKLGKTFAHRGQNVGYFEAKCPYGKFLVKSPRILFENEADIVGQPPQTVLKGSATVPCTPKG